MATYPKWAPKTLIESLGRLKNFLREERDPVLRKIAAEQSDFTHRLLMRPEMERAWRTVLRTPLVGEYKNYSETQRILHLWRTIAHVRMTVLSAGRRRPAKGRADLKALARNIRHVIRSIQHDYIAREICETGIQRLLVERHQKYCKDILKAEGAPPQAQVVSALDLDGYDAAQSLNDGAANRWARHAKVAGEYRHWYELPDIERFAYWTGELHALRFMRVLESVADLLQREALKPSLIRQPRRKDAGLRPLLIRSLSAYFHSHYGKPLGETVAIISSAVLDTTLTRDDVRAYLRLPGKTRTKKIQNLP